MPPISADRVPTAKAGAGSAGSIRVLLEPDQRVGGNFFLLVGNLQRQIREVGIPPNVNALTGFRPRSDAMLTGQKGGAVSNVQRCQCLVAFVKNGNQTAES